MRGQFPPAKDHLWLNKWVYYSSQRRKHTACGVVEHLRERALEKIWLEEPGWVTWGRVKGSGASLHVGCCQKAGVFPCPGTDAAITHSVREQMFAILWLV